MVKNTGSGVRLPGSPPGSDTSPREPRTTSRASLGFGLSLLFRRVAMVGQGGSLMAQAGLLHRDPPQVAQCPALSKQRGGR